MIGQSGLILCHIAQAIWRERLTNRRVALYIDNEAARYGLASGTSPTRDSAWLINEYWATGTKNETSSWIDRVPSASNCADGPPRGRFDVPPNWGMAIKKINVPDNYERDLAKQ